jgi:hypothetical protein
VQQIFVPFHRDLVRLATPELQQEAEPAEDPAPAPPIGSFIADSSVDGGRGTT